MGKETSFSHVFLTHFRSMHDLGHAAQLRKYIDTISTLTNDSISDHDKEALECIPTSNQNTEMKQILGWRGACVVLR